MQFGWRRLRLRFEDVVTIYIEHGLVTERASGEVPEWASQLMQEGPHLRVEFLVGPGEGAVARFGIVGPQGVEVANAIMDAWRSYRWDRDTPDPAPTTP